MKNYLSLAQSENVAVNSNKITLKLAVILSLILVLLIPQIMIKDLIKDREGRQNQISHSIAQQIGGQVDIVGPILCVPYKTVTEISSIDKKTKLTKVEVIEEISLAYFTAENIEVKSDVNVENIKKGIYKMPFYKSTNLINGSFSSPNFATWKNIETKNIQWQDAYLIMGVSDLKGISENPKLTINGKKIDFEPGNNGSNLLNSPVHVKLTEEFAKSGGQFSIDLSLRGTTALNFASTARNNKLEMTSNWPHPNFESTMNTNHTTYDAKTGRQVINRGNTLPTDRAVTKDGFTATWNENQFSIDQPSQWLQNTAKPKLSNRLMGAEFVNVADDYDKSHRSAKYMALIIALVFIAFFIIELLKGMRVHPFQYVLVGSSIAIFFILLLAISEYTGFNVAYLVASAATIILIGLYSLSVFKSKAMAVSITSLLTALFVFLFVILIAVQYSLLIGAVGLFMILAAIMFVTKDVKWYGLSKEPEVEKPEEAFSKEASEEEYLIDKSEDMDLL